MLKYKLTDQNMQTHNGCQWVLGEKKTTDGSGELCGKGWLHFYDDPILAIFLNPTHAKISDPRVFECKAGGNFKNDKGLKGGATELTLTKELQPMNITHKQRVTFAILCVKKVFHDKKWNTWADNWLNNTDRSANAATHAATHAYATYAATYADAATYAALAAAHVATYATYAATYAAHTAIYTAYASENLGSLDLIEIAHLVYNQKEI